LVEGFMRIPIRVAMAGSVLLLSGGVYAQDPNPLTAVKADHWTEAQVAAARFADPVAEKLVLYLRLRAPGAATAAEIADFMQRNPDWPAQAMLERRRQEAIATDPDDAAVLSQCSPAPTLAAAMLRCAEAIANAGRAADADALARQAWVNEIDSATGEAAFLRRWGGIASADDQWARFQRLAWLSDPAAAARQITRLTGTHHTAAEARLAAKRDDPQTEPLVTALPPALQVDPGLVLDRVRALRRADRDAEAAALMGRIAESANVSEFWSERNVLARKLLHDGDAKTAYNIVTGHGQIADEQRAEADFFAGFIALRMLHDAATAEKHFRSLADSHSAITQSRAHYWLARTAATAGQDARPEYAKSAAWPTTFYGQLAALADAGYRVGLYRPRGAAGRRLVGRLGRSPACARVRDADGRARPDPGGTRPDGRLRGLCRNARRRGVCCAPDGPRRDRLAPSGLAGAVRPRRPA
jgi:soluble lytic murein transglycosylase